MPTHPGRAEPKVGPNDRSDPGDPEEATDKDEQEEGRLGRHDDGAVEKPPKAPLRSPGQP